ncbi:MAG: hypothetical protein ACXAEU_22780 [Candidatus Hodarchaeales archaeon]|jgi:hypothetical protein
MNSAYYSKLEDTLDLGLNDGSMFENKPIETSNCYQTREFRQSNYEQLVFSVFGIKRIDHKPVEIEWEPSVYFFVGSEHRDPWSGEDLSAGFTHVFQTRSSVSMRVKPNFTLDDDLKRAIERGYSIEVQENYSLRSRRIKKVISLLSAYFPEGMLCDLPHAYKTLNPGPCNIDKYITIALAYIDLQLRLCREDCLTPGIVEQISSSLDLKKVTKQEVVTIRKHLFHELIQTLNLEEKKIFRQKYAASRRIETQKLEQVALETLANLPSSLDRNRVFAKGRELLAMMRKKSYNVHDISSFLDYFPLATFRAAGYEWFYLEEILGESITKMEHAAMNFLYRIGIKIRKMKRGNKKRVKTIDSALLTYATFSSVDSAALGGAASE